MDMEVRKIAVVDDFHQICRTLQYNHREILAVRRDAYLVKRKIEVARHLREKGYTCELIGHAMNKDHSTISHYLRKK